MRKLETNDLPLPLLFPSLTIPLSNTLPLCPPPLTFPETMKDGSEELKQEDVWSVWSGGLRAVL